MIAPADSKMIAESRRTCRLRIIRAIKYRRSQVANTKVFKPKLRLASGNDFSIAEGPVITPFSELQSAPRQQGSNKISLSKSKELTDSCYQPALYAIIDPPYGRLRGAEINAKSKMCCSVSPGKSLC